jgi:hypothetical protein
VELWRRVFVTIIFAWICAGVAAVATLGAAYFFDRSADEGIERSRNEAAEKIAVLENSSQQLRESNSKLEVEQGKLTQENLKLSIELERAKADHIALQNKLASRSVTPDQQAAIVASLKDIPKATVQVFHLGDPEAYEYAESITSTLEKAGFKVTDRSIGALPEPFYGLMISEGLGAYEIIKAFKAVGIAIRPSGSKTDPAAFYVGPRRPPL